MNTAWQKFKDNVPLRRVVVFLLIVACLYEMRAMMNTIPANICWMHSLFSVLSFSFGLKFLIFMAATPTAPMMYMYADAFQSVM